MKRTYIATTRKDRMLIIIMAAAVVLITIMAFLFKDRKGLGLSKAELQQAYNNDMSGLVISEVMTSNDGVWVNSNNDKCDYLELYNGTKSTINLKGYGLSDVSTTVKWRFPSYELASGAYMVVALNGISNEPLTADFKLSAAGGETVILTTDTGHILDAVDTVSLNSNQVMMRQGDGSWVIADSGTPGYENSQAGLNDYIASLTASETDNLKINEILPRNNGNFALSDGSRPGFIEVKNTGSESINLADYRLSDSSDIPFRYGLPNKVLAANEIYVVYTGNTSPNSGIETTGFNINSQQGEVVLSKQGKIIQTVTYDNVPNGCGYEANGDNYFVSAVVSPGYENDAEGIKQYQMAHLKAPTGLIINEVMNNNTKYLAQNAANYYDWIELYNNSNQSISLADYYLTNDDKRLDKYQLPDLTLGAKEYIVIMCSGNMALTNNSYYHAGFKISDYESLYLTSGQKIVDSVYIGDVPLNYSYGRTSNGGWLYSSSPTPKKENEGGSRAVTAAVQFNISGGIYNDVDKLAITIDGNGTIYYTTNGAQPTKTSKVYTGPLVLTGTTVIKAMAVSSNCLASPVTVNSYIINENHTVPVVSVALNPTDLTYINKHAGSRGLERAAHAELFEDTGSFSINCSVACFGGNARYLTKKSYALRFDSEWGASELDYQVFPNRDCSVYDSLVLRSGSTDYFDAFIRDITATSLVDDYTDVDTQAYKTVVVYINGKYWGVYNLREKINASFVSDHYNVTKDSITLARIDGRTSSGSYSSYKKLRSYARNNNMSIASNYAYMESQINMVDCIDYWIAECYVTNNDMLNCRFFRTPEYDDNRWHYIFYDLDYAWLNAHINYYTKYFVSARMGLPGSYTYENDIIHALFGSSTFRKLYVERLTYNMQNTWKLENVLARIDEIEATFAPEMARNQKRWGLSYSHWTKSVEELRTYARKRDSYLRSQTKSFFGLSSAELKAVFGDEG